MTSENIIITNDTISMKILLTVSLLLLAVALYFFSPTVAIALVVVTPILLIHSQGVEIDSDNYQYRYYNSFAGLKIDEWKTLQLYEFVTLITLYGRKRAHHMTSERNVDTTGIIYKIYLLDKKHRVRLLILRTENVDKAKQTIEELKSSLNLPYRTYNPNISNRGKNRRSKNDKC